MQGNRKDADHNSGNFFFSFLDEFIELPTILERRAKDQEGVTLKA